MFSRFLEENILTALFYFKLTALNTGGKLGEVGLFFNGQRGKLGLVLKKRSMRCGSVCASFKLRIGVMSAYYTCTLQIHCLLHMYHCLLFTIYLMILT